MESNQSRSSAHNLTLLGIIIGLALIICAVIGSRTLISIRQQGRTLSVTGAAYKPIRSDLAVWRANISANSFELTEGYAQLDQGISSLRDFLSTNGIEPDQYELSVVSVHRRTNREGELTGYSLSRGVKLESTDVDRITTLSTEASAMIKQGIMIESRPVQYLYTHLDSLKLEMIQAATKSAKERAERLAGTTGHQVGSPVSASVGVFQIRPLRSQEVSSYGISDLSSIDKEIVSTVHVDFLID